MTDVQRLMMENQNLLETKNALNIVKDDLLQELDQIANKYAKVKIELENAKKEKGKYQISNLEFGLGPGIHGSVLVRRFLMRLTLDNPSIR